MAKKTAAKKVAKKVAKKTTKKVAKKTAAKKCGTKACAKKTTIKSSVARDPKKPLTKTQLVAMIAENTELERKKVVEVMDLIPEIMQKELKGPGIFQFPGLLKIERKRIPAQKAVKNWKNPFTGEIGTKPAKPACNKIKVRPLKKLKDMA